MTGAGGQSAGGGGASTTTQSTTGQGGTGGGTTGSGAGEPCGEYAARYGGTDAAHEALAGQTIVDADGGSVIVGEMSGVLQGPSVALTSAGAKDIFVLRRNALGQPTYAKRFGATYDDRAVAAAATPDGGVVLVGTFDGNVDFGGGAFTSIAGPDAFVVKLDVSGAHVFSLQVENADFRAVSASASGDIFVAGDFKGTTKVGGTAFTSSASDLLFARLSATGTVLGAASFPSAQKTSAIVLSAAADHLYVGGGFQSTLSLGGAPLMSAGSKDVFVAKLTADFNLMWAVSFGDDTAQEARGVAALPDGGVALAGAFRGTLDIGPNKLVADTLDDVFVARLGADGGALFATKLGDADSQVATAIAADETGTLHVLGRFGGTLSPAALTSAGGDDVLRLAMSPSGVLLDEASYGGLLDQRGSTLAWDACGAVVWAGDFNGSFSVGPETLTAGGSRDIVWARKPLP